MYSLRSNGVTFLCLLSKWFDSFTCGFEVQPSIGQTFLQFLGRLDLGFILLDFPDLSVGQIGEVLLE